MQNFFFGFLMGALAFGVFILGVACYQPPPPPKAER
jgi:hypothetical protein